MRLKIKKRFLGRPLSQKERLTWKLLAEGLTSKEIAKKRGVSVGTVLTVRSVLLGKLGVHNATSLVALWYKRKMDRIRNRRRR